MRHLTVVFLIILLFLTPSCKYFKGKKLFGHKKDDVIAVWQSKQDSLRLADSLKTVALRLEAAENARLDSIRLVEERKVAEQKNKYNIIVGSFITPEYAQGLSDVYRQKGYETNIINMQGGRFRLVSAESFSDVHRAFTRLKHYQESEEPNAWIYQNR